MSKAMMRLKTVKHPISEETIGFRLQAAVPNKEGRNFGKPVPSFGKRYLIIEGSDHSEAILKDRFDEVLQKFRADLKWAGYDDAYFVNAE